MSRAISPRTTCTGCRKQIGAAEVAVTFDSRRDGAPVFHESCWGEWKRWCGRNRPVEAKVDESLAYPDGNTTDPHDFEGSRIVVTTLPGSSWGYVVVVHDLDGTRIASTYRSTTVWPRRAHAWAWGRCAARQAILLHRAH